MSTNCLVTKLKGSVQNDELYKINELRMFLPAGNVMRLNAGANTVSGMSFTITPLEGSFTVDNTVYNTGSACTFSGSGNHTLTVPSTADAVISISDKQAFKEIYFNSGDRVSSISGKHRAILNPDFGYMQNLVSIQGYMMYYCSEFGYFPELTEFGKSNYYQRMTSEVYRNYVNDKNLPNLQWLVISLFGNTDFVNIKTFSSLTKLIALTCSSATGVVGAIEDLANGQIEAGRTTGSLTVRSTRNVTYQGVIPESNPTYTITFENGSYTVSVS